MIMGIGADLLRIERIARMGERNGRIMLDRMLAAPERAALAGLGDHPADWPGCAARIAALVAAKEAFFKALGTGLVMPLRWADVAVGGPRVAPTVTLSGAAAAAFSAQGGTACRLTLSATQDFILATVALFGRGATTGNTYA